MGENMRKVLLSLTVISLVSAAFAPPASADHAWGGYHWGRTSNPFTISLGDNVSSAWDPYLTEAAGDWSANDQGNPLNAIVVSGATTSRKCKPSAGRVEVCADRYGRNGWLGLAQIWVSSQGHITQGVTKMNDTYYNTQTYDTPFWRGAVMCQEIGHTFGLDHQDESGADFRTCMDYADNPDEDNTHPNAHDYEQLASIYSHLDSGTTIGAATTARRGSDVASTHRVSRSKIVTRYSDGSRKITFIFWAK
jgi:hypothetical protein